MNGSRPLKQPVPEVTARKPMESLHPPEPDVIVIGAGAAGISAAVALADSGLAVTIVEARDRIGGRIFTRLDSKDQAPIELGAEFIHGKPPQLWNLLENQKVQIREVDGDNWCFEKRHLTPCTFFADVDEILQKMSDREHDRSFLEFLAAYRSKSNNNDDDKVRRAREWATSYVTGFNAANPSLVGVHWLVKGMRAEEQIEGHRAFRTSHGYADLIAIFQQQLENRGIPVQTNTVVEGITWRAGHVTLTTSCPDGMDELSASRVLITVPLGVLQASPGQAGAIQFRPELPPEKQDSIRNAIMGKVIRVSLRFRERFWDSLPNSGAKSATRSGTKSRGKSIDTNSKTLSGMSFLFSHDDWFPTWWTTLPEKIPILIGWAPFHCAERLSGRSESFVVEQSINALHRLLGVTTQELESLLENVYFHDWQDDPFSRGAYSYGKAGYDGAQQNLAKPVDGALFFAGEATDIGGHNGTVHGAIASGHRAAGEIISAAKSRAAHG
ncbi:MAG: NAD(P)/FAD-dependent oxidoreductase [Candidatus Sulfotelmatobacter sp.]